MPPKTQSSASEWAAKIIKNKDNDAVLQAMLQPQMLPLMDAKFSRPEQCGDIVPGLQEVAKTCPEIFTKPTVSKLLVDVLRCSGGPAPREGHWQHNFVISILSSAYTNEDKWPVSIVAAFLGDSIDKRNWVEVATNAPFVANIVTAFPCSSGMPPPVSASKPHLKAGAEPDPKRRKLEQNEQATSAAAATKGAIDMEEEIVLGGGGGASEEPTAAVRPRFRSDGQQKDIAKMVQDLVKEQMEVKEESQNERRAKSLLKTLPFLMGYEIVRRMVALKIDSWINNTNTVRFTRELLPRLANECTLETEGETMSMIVKIRPKAHATKEHLETISMFARTNVHFCQIALDAYLREETSNLDFLTTNKSLRHKQQLEALLRSSGTAHLYVERPLSHGGGRERLGVVDAGTGPVRFNVAGPMRNWNDGPKHGCIMVATEAQACGKQGLEGEALVSAVAACSASLVLHGVVGLVIVLSPSSKAPPKAWQQQQNVRMVPVVIAPLGDGTAGLLEAASSARVATLVRTPIEVELGFQLKVLADQPSARRGLTALMRKLLKLGEAEPVALCNELLEPVPDMAHGDPEKRKEWGMAIIEMVCFVSIFQALHALEVSAPSIHAERQSQGENRAAKAVALLRGQIAMIQEASMRWAFVEGPKIIGHDGMVEVVRKLVFREKTHSYSKQSDPLDAAERGAITSLLLNEIPVTAETLVWVAKLGLPSPSEQQFQLTGRIPREQALDTVDVLVARAVALEAKRLSAGVVDHLEVANLVVPIMHVGLIQSIFELSRFQWPGLETLAPIKRFWQASLTAVKIACFNPETVGASSWEQHPTIKELMVSLITGVYVFPPIPGLAAALINGNVIDCDTATQLLQQADAQAIEKAKMVVAQTQLQDNDKIVLSMQLDNAIIMDPSTPARQPTAEVYERLRERELDVIMGHALRRSRKPDFLLDTIRLHGADSSKCVVWLLPIIEKFPETVNCLPKVTIAQMLLADLSHQVEAKMQRKDESKKINQMDLSSMVMQLAMPLVKGDEGSQVTIELFASKLHSRSSLSRATAVRALDMLAAAAVAPSDEMDAGDVAVKQGWLGVLERLPCFPILRDGLTSTVRKALLVETDAGLIQEYLSHMSGSLQMDPRELSLHVSGFLLERTLIAEHLSRTKSAMRSVIQALAAGISHTVAFQDDASNPLVQCGKVMIPRSVARAVVFAACLSAGGDAWEDAAKIFDQVVPASKGGCGDVSRLGLEGVDLERMIKCCEERVYLAAVNAAGEEVLRRAVGMYGSRPACLAAVVKKLKECTPEGAAAPRGVAKAVSILKKDEPALSEWLRSRWLSEDVLPRVKEGCQGGDGGKAGAAARPVAMDVDTGVGAEDTVMAGDANSGPHTLPADWDLVEIAKQRPRDLEGAVWAAVRRVHQGDGKAEAKLSDELQRICIGDGVGARGLCTDILILISPVLTAKQDKDGAGDEVMAKFWAKPLTAVVGALVGWGNREAIEASARWLLKSDIVPEKREIICQGVCVPPTSALDLLSFFITGENGGSAAWEGYWEEGGGSDVNEILTRREHCSAMAVKRELSAGECIALAGFIVCEAAADGRGGKKQGEVRMGRMQLLLEAVGDKEASACDVADALMPIVSSGGDKGMVAGAWELLERLKLALPKALAHVQPPERALVLPAVDDGNVMDGNVMDGNVMVRQTSKLDKLLQTVLSQLQEDDKAPSAMVVARQIASAHPRLIATHMLSLRALCAGKSLLRLGDLASRNVPRLLSYVVSIILAARPYSLSSLHINSLLDELLLVYGATVRFEAVLEPLLSKLSTLLRAVASRSESGMAYVSSHSSQLETLAVWYTESSELQALLHQIKPGAVVQGLGLGGESEACRQVGQLSARLRIRSRHGEVTSAQRSLVEEEEALLEALEDADMSTTGAAGAELLELLERPVMDLLSAPWCKVRDRAYTLALRLAVLRPEAASRVAEALLACLEMGDEGVQSSAVKNAPELIHLSAATASRIFIKLFRLAREGKEDAMNELLRSTRSGLTYACRPAR